MKPRLKSILIAECGDHLKILEQIFLTLKSRFSVSFLISSRQRCHLANLFPSAQKGKVDLTSVNGLFIFLKLLFSARRHDLVYISTGPDGDHPTDYFLVITFYVYCKLYGHKTVMTLRNIKQYTRNNSKLLDFVRWQSIQHVSSFTFETMRMRMEFEKLSIAPNARTAVSYDRYPDVGLKINKDVEQLKSKYKQNHSKLSIGLLGTINHDRRDYNLLFNAINMLNQSDRDKIEIILLGSILTDKAATTVTKLKNLVSVHVEENIVPEEKFIDLGKLCDLLIAPLNHNKQYGSLHGTGAIGDAIYLQKYIVIPKFFDPDGEFDDFCFYYENAEDITCLIKQQLSGCQQPSERIFKKFNSNLVLKKVCSDLGFKP